MDREAAIRGCLQAALSPSDLLIRDDSAQHVGHAGAAGGGGHFSVRLVATAFADLPMVKRHQLVYQALESLLGAEIHAVSIQALAPGET